MKKEIEFVDGDFVKVISNTNEFLCANSHKKIHCKTITGIFRSRDYPPYVWIERKKNNIVFWYMRMVAKRNKN